jgi:1-acyl-sn-glycerol-3-phosphate acyltransferase
VTGAERVPAAGGLLIVANHLSFVDPPIIGGLTPRRVDFMAMTELFRNPVSAALMRALGAFPVDRAKPDPRAVREAVRRLRAGHCVGIFPEGGIREGAQSVLGGEPVFRPGAGMIALLGEVPILPVIVRHTRAPYRWQNWLRRAPMSVTFGAPFSLWVPGHVPLHQRRQLAREVLRSALLSTAKLP